VLARQPDRGVEQPRLGQRAGGVVHHHHLDVAGVHRGPQRGEAAPLGGVPRRPARHEHRLLVRAPLLLHEPAHDVGVLGPVHDDDAVDVRAGAGGPQRPRQHRRPEQRQQHLAGRGADPGAGARGDQHHGGAGQGGVVGHGPSLPDGRGAA